MARGHRNGPDWKYIKAKRRAEQGTPVPLTPRPALAGDHLFLTEDDRAIIFNPFLGHAFLIYEHHKARDEHIVALKGSRSPKDGLFETAILRPDHRSYQVKLRVSPDGVYEFGREEV